MAIAIRWIAPTVAATASSCPGVSSSLDVLCQGGHTMSDNVSDADPKERAERLSGVITTILEEQGYEAAVAQTRKLFANSTPEEMEQIKPHLTSLAREFLI